MLNPKTTIIGSILAGIGASACCLGPLVLLSLGIGGAWISHLTALESYRPVFLAATAVLLGVSYWRLYRSPMVCAVGQECLADRTRRTQRVVFWIVLPLVVLMAVSPWILLLLER
jgi:mercuric ion transport protein